MTTHDKKLVYTGLAVSCMVTIVQLTTAGAMDLQQKAAAFFLGIAMPLLCSARLTPDEHFSPEGQRFPWLQKMVITGWICTLLGFIALLYHFGNVTGLAFLCSAAISLFYLNQITPELEPSPSLSSDKKAKT